MIKCKSTELIFMEEKRKIIGTLIGILGFIVAIAGLTYAMYTTSVSSNTITGGHECITINYTKGEDVAASELNFVSNYTESPAQTEIVFYQDASCGNNLGTLYIYTNQNSSDSLITGLTTDGQTHGVLKYTVTKQIGSQSATEIATGYITNKGDTAIEVGKLENTSTTYKVYLWLEIDETGTITNSTISEAQYSGYIHASARQTSTYTE